MATQAPGRQRSTPCVFYEKGWCKSGSSCRFTHGTTDQRVLTASTIGAEGAAASIPGDCRFFARGKCLRGQKCPFMHSNYSADETLRHNVNAEDRATKRPAPGSGVSSPRLSPRHKLAGPSIGWQKERPSDYNMSSATSRGVSKEGGASMGGAGSTGEDRRDGHDGARSESAAVEVPWEPASNEDGTYFFGAPGAFHGPGAAAAATSNSTSIGAGARAAGSWRDVASIPPLLQTVAKS